jgi:hypothetical protein
VVGVGEAEELSVAPGDPLEDDPSDGGAANLLSRPSYARVIAFAQQIGVHPGIVAGRIRYEKKNYRIFSPLVGIGEVSKHLSSAG